MKWPKGFGLGSPNSSVRNSADSRLSREATMVWLKLMVIVLSSQPLRYRRDNAALFRRGQLQRDVVGIAEFQDVGRSDVFDRLVKDSDLVEMCFGRIQFVLAGEPEGDVVESDAILVEAIRGDRTQSE